MDTWFKTAGIPVNVGKNERGVEVTFLGITICTPDLTARLPPKKFDKYWTDITSVLEAGKVTRKKLKSLVGRLFHATCVWPAGKFFLKRLTRLNCSMIDRNDYHFVRLSKFDACKDLLFWRDHWKIHRGIGLLQTQDTVLAAEIGLMAATDASGRSAAATFAPPGAKTTRWIVYRFTDKEMVKDISWKELRMVTLMLATWLSLIASLVKDSIGRKKIVIRCDNEGVCKAARRRWAHSPLLMGEFRAIQVLAFRGNFQFGISWLRGTRNIVPDALSRLHEEGQWKRACENAQPPLHSPQDVLVIPPWHPY